MRTAYKCRAYPTPEQAAVVNRTFGCVRLVWNTTLAERSLRYRTEGARTSYRETDAALTTWKRGEELAFLSEVSCVPLQQTLRHQHTAFGNFFTGRACCPRLKSRAGRQSAHYTRSAFRMRDGVLALAKTSTPLRFVWSFDDVDLATLDPTMVVVVIDRWFPPSETCSVCGHVPAELTLTVRHWTCPGCRTRHDRDLNAAKNILAAGRAVIRSDSGDACGADVRRQGSSLPRSAVKQESRAVRHSA